MNKWFTVGNHSILQNSLKRLKWNLILYFDSPPPHERSGGDLECKCDSYICGHCDEQWELTIIGMIKLAFAHMKLAIIFIVYQNLRQNSWGAEVLIFLPIWWQKILFDSVY